MQYLLDTRAHRLLRRRALLLRAGAVALGPRAHPDHRPGEALHDPAHGDLPPASACRDTRSTSATATCSASRRSAGAIVAAIAAVRGRTTPRAASLACTPPPAPRATRPTRRHIANPSLRKTYGFTFETGPFVGQRTLIVPSRPTRSLIKRDAKAGMLALMQQCICAIELIGLRFFKTEAEIKALRTVRDELLATTEAGRDGSRSLSAPSCRCSPP